MLKRFGDWCINRQGYDDELQLEIFSADAIRGHEPKDAKWSPPLNQDSSSYKYYFNVPGDDCGSSLNPCYYLSISVYAEGISIDFSRNGSYSDSGKNVAGEVFMAVLKGLGEFLDAKSPKGMQWSAVYKTRVNQVTGRVENPRAREHIYEGWAIRNVFPDRYVALDPQKWVRRDIYDSEFVPKGYPPVPEGLSGKSSPGEKKIAYKKMEEAREAARQEIRRREQEERERLERERREREEAEERQRQKELQRAVEDPQINPNGVKVGDVVDLHDAIDAYSTSPRYYRNRVGRIVRFERNYYEENDILAVVALLDDSGEEEGYERSFKIAGLKKETEESRAQREERRRQEEERQRREQEERLQAAIADPQKNPDGVGVGDAVITYIPDRPENDQNGLVGIIQRFEISYWDGDLMAHVDWDERSRGVLGAYNADRAMRVQYLRKNTGDVADRIAAERRRREQEELIARQREREEAEREEQEMLRRNAESAAELVGDTENNPQGLKVGDHIVVTGGWPHRNVGRRGYIVAMHRAYWGREIQAEVRFHNSRAASTTSVYLRNLQRDESEESQRIRQRQQERLQRAETLRQAVQESGGFQVGDTVVVVSGLHRNKRGRIIRFQGGTQGNVRAVMMDDQNNQFTANIRTLRRADQNPPTAATPPAGLTTKFMV